MVADLRELKASIRRNWSAQIVSAERQASPAALRESVPETTE
jgi:hypothetical protein